MLDVMHDRIPPALAWLIRRRRSVAGRLELAKGIASKNQEQLVEIEAAIHAHQQRADQLRQCLRRTEIDVSALERDLAALDQTLLMHEIHIDPKQLGAIRPRRRLCRSGHGAVTRSIHAALGEVAPRALSTDQVAAFVIAHCDFEFAPEGYSAIRFNIRKRLQRIVQEGNVVRLHARYGGGQKVGMWCRPVLADQDERAPAPGENATAPSSSPSN